MGCLALIMMLLWIRWLASGVNDGISTGILHSFPRLMELISKFYDLDKVKSYYETHAFST